MCVSPCIRLDACAHQLVNLRLLPGLQIELCPLLLFSSGPLCIAVLQ